MVETLNGYKHSMTKTIGRIIASSVGNVVSFQIFKICVCEHNWQLLA
jgi:hypothetical protein